MFYLNLYNYLETEQSALDLFCGAGGIGTGFTQAGFNITEAIDIEPICAKTYQANHKQTKVRVMNILDYKFAQNDFDIVFSGVIGGSPCQDFSQLNLKKNEHSDRANLLFEFIRVIEEVRPEFCLLENVYSVPKLMKKEVIKQLQQLGYYVSSEVVDCSQLGAVQTRKRWLTLGAKKKHIFPKSDKIVRVAKEILTNQRSEIKARPETLRKIQSLPSGKWCALEGQSYKVYYVIDPNKPLPAVVNPLKLRYIKPDKSGYLSMQEMYASMGFPKNYEWFGTLSQKGQMLANAFPVETSRAFAEAIIKELN